MFDGPSERPPDSRGEEPKRRPPRRPVGPLPMPGGPPIPGAGPAPIPPDYCPDGRLPGISYSLEYWEPKDILYKTGMVFRTASATRFPSSALPRLERNPGGPGDGVITPWEIGVTFPDAKPITSWRLIWNNPSTGKVTSQTVWGWGTNPQLLVDNDCDQAPTPPAFPT